MPDRASKSDVVLNLDVDRPNHHFCNQFAFVITIGQCFGLMPIRRFKKNGRCDVQFKWYSPRILYWFVNFLGSFVLGIFCILEFSFNGFQLDKSGTLVFYIMNCFGAIVFVSVSRNWSYILNEWTTTEIALKSYGPLKLRTRLILTTLIITILAIVEHLLFILNDISKTAKCEEIEDYNAVEEYFVVAHPQVFTLVDVSYWRAILVKVANILSTLTWNYTDSFIILISSALALKFSQVARKLENKNFQDTNDRFWRETREDFNRLCKLSRVIDEHLSALVTISFFNNIFFICIQLYNSLKEREGFIEKLYFFYSFVFLLVRTTSVTLYGAWVNDESRKPLDMLHSVPPKQYNIEVSRFIEQIATMPIGLTGSKFFTVTRGFLLKIVGTIITLELMLLQFGPLVKHYKSNILNSNNDKCNLTDT